MTEFNDFLFENAFVLVSIFLVEVAFKFYLDNWDT